MAPLDSSASESASQQADPSQSQPVAPQTIGTLFAQVSDHLSTLVSTEIQLAKAKAMRSAQAAGLGVALLAVAGFLAVFGFGWLLSASFRALALVVPHWAAALIVAGGLLLLAGILALVGIASLKRSHKYVPDPKAGLQADLDAVKASFVKQTVKLTETSKDTP
ncbi:MAG: phage holin family protein [Actinomycetaceae bacterium]|nr:phage holin family protein [Actinomycetaceae bacterium]